MSITIITTVHIRYLEYPLSRTFINPTFSSVPSALSVTAPINAFSISNPAISNFHYVELFSWSLQRSLGLFSIRYLERFHFTHSFFLISIKRKLNVKNLGEKCQTLNNLESGLSNKKVAKKYGILTFFERK